MRSSLAGRLLSREWERNQERALFFVIFRCLKLASWSERTLEACETCCGNVVLFTYVRDRGIGFVLFVVVGIAQESDWCTCSEYLTHVKSRNSVYGPFCPFPSRNHYHTVHSADREMTSSVLTRFGVRARSCRRYGA